MRAMLSWGREGRRVRGLALLGVLWAAPAPAWWASSHMVAAQVAYDQLRPATRAEADRLIALLAAAEPRVDHFVPAAAWLDLLKRQGAPELQPPDAWHFVNLPHPSPSEPALPEGEHVVSALRHHHDVLRDRRAADLERAYALRVLIHLVADAHQPLHCINKLGPDHPQGDLGGNAVPVLWPADPHATLHILWDDALGLYPPLGPGEDWRQLIPPAAAALAADVPRAGRADAAVLDPEAWVRESYALALEVAYPGLEPGAPPTPAYLERGRPVVRERLALAGYRLAALLDDALAQQ